MAVYARTRDGKSHKVNPSLGATPHEVVNTISNMLSSLTGSAVSLDNAWVETADGTMIRYGDVEAFEPGSFDER